jgi:hypothetical protein
LSDLGITHLKNYRERHHRWSLEQKHYLRQHCIPVWKLLTLDFDYSPQIVRADSKIPVVLKV